MCSLAYFVTFLGFILFLLMVYLLVHYWVLLHHSDFDCTNVCSIFLI